MSRRLSFARKHQNMWMETATSYVQKGWKLLAIVIDCPPHMHSHLPTSSISIPFYQDLCLLGFCFIEFTKQGKHRGVYRLTTHCGLGLDCHGVGLMFMNTPSPTHKHPSSTCGAQKSYRVTYTRKVNAMYSTCLHNS